MPHPTQPSRTHAAALLRPLAALLATSAVCSAWADDPNPYYLGVSQGITHNSNIYAIPNGQGATYSSTGLLGGFDQPIGRERLYANGSVNVNRFEGDNVSALNNVSYSLAGGLDWASINKLSGSFYASANRSLASLGNNGTSIGVEGVRDLLTTSGIGTRLRWGGDSLLTVEGGLAHDRASYSAQTAQSGNVSQDSGNIGLYYRPSSQLRLGTALRATHGDQPYATLIAGGGFEANSFNSRSLDLSADWTPTGRSNLSGRLGWTRQTNSASSQGLNFSGLTGALNGTYQATGKIALNASLSRNTGVNSALFSTTLIPPSTQFPNGVSIIGLSQYSQVTTTLALGATYAATAKINARASYQYQHAALSNNSSSGTDDLRSFGIGATYAPARNWLIACDLNHYSRSDSGFAVFSYSGNSIGCSGQYTWGR